MSECQTPGDVPRKWNFISKISPGDVISNRPHGYADQGDPNQPEADLMVNK